MTSDECLRLVLQATGAPNWYANTAGRLAIEKIIREAVAARDMEWWEKCALVDNVAPTPDAVRHWIAISQELFVKEAVAAERQKLRRALCPNCGPNHVLDNGRVWGFCGLWRIIDKGFTEQEAIGMIREPEPPSPAPPP